jgi:hypothetical protein
MADIGHYLVQPGKFLTRRLRNDRVGVSVTKEMHMIEPAPL